MTMKKIFVPLTKVDEEKRLVYGVMTAEVADKDGEILDYKSSKPHIEKWSGDIFMVTKGKSRGNVRAMHQPVAVGKLTEMVFDDDAKRVEICTYVQDDDAWEKVKEGIYTGYSLGGSYAKKWQDADNAKLTRYTGVPVEVSLVDNPCVPTAHFTVIKAAGGTEEREFKSVDADNDEMTAEETGVMAKWIGRMFKQAFGKVADDYARDGFSRPAGPEPDYEDGFNKREFSTARRKELAGSGAALPDGSYPIVNEQDLKNAIHAYGRAKDKEKAKRHIIARAKTLGLSHLIPEGWGGSKKGAGLDDETEAMLKSVAAGLSLEDVQAASHDEISTLLKAMYEPAKNAASPGFAVLDEQDDISALLKGVFGPTALPVPSVDDEPFAALVKISATPLKKSMGLVSSLAYAFQSIRQAQRDLIREGQVEKDDGDKAMAKELGEIAQKLAALMAQKAEHEGKEAITLTDEDDLRFAQYSGVTLTGVEQ